MSAPIGGQAVLEGVMMRGPSNWAVAVRKPNGQIAEVCRPIESVMKRHWFFRLPVVRRSEEHTSELQSQSNLVCRLLLEKKKKQDRRDLSHDIGLHSPGATIHQRTRYRGENSAQSSIAAASRDIIDSRGLLYTSALSKST